MVEDHHTVVPENYEQDDCPSCGKRVKRTWHYCPVCGRRLDDEPRDIYQFTGSGE